jgi:hypothetical protein
MNPQDLLSGYVNQYGGDLGQAAEAAVNASIVNPEDRKTARRIVRGMATRMPSRPISTEEQFLLSQLQKQDPVLANDYLQGKVFARSTSYYIKDRHLGGDKIIGEQYMAPQVGLTNLNGRNLPNDTLIVVTGIAFEYATTANTNTNPADAGYLQTARDAANNPRVPNALINGEVEVQAGEQRILRIPTDKLLIMNMNGGHAGLFTLKLDSWPVIKGGTQITITVRGANGVALPANFSGFTGANHFVGVHLVATELVRGKVN